MKQDIQRRRQERIREILTSHAQSEPLTDQYRYPKLEQNRTSYREAPDYSREVRDPIGNEEFIANEQGNGEFPILAIERDPEMVWRESRKQWSDQYGWSDKPVRDGSGRRPAILLLRIQVAIAILLFLAVSAMLQFPQPWTERANQYVHQSLQQNMNLAALTSWYEATFGGSPAFIPIWSQPDQEAQVVQANYRLVPPIDGEVLQPFTLALQGIQLIPRKEGADVLSAAMGRVIDVVRNDNDRFTITIQHTEGLVTTYGQLATSEVVVNDWLEAGEIIGTMPVGDTTNAADMATMYFAIQQNGRYVNPLDVMDLD